MTITWLGHACFVLESGGYRILLDPFKDVPGLPNTAALVHAVYCSHGHFDHAYTDHVTVLEGVKNPFKLREVASFHDDQGGAVRGNNTIRAFTAEGITVVHLGDLGHQLSAKQVEKIGKCDILLLPIGGTYTLDPMQAKAVVYALQPTVVIPMHYHKEEMGFEVLRTVEEFTDLFPPSLVKNYPVCSLTVDGDTPAQIAVLRV